MDGLELNKPQEVALDMLIEKLQNAKKSDDPGQMIYESAVHAEIKPRKFFPILYRMLLGSKNGPKLGPLIADMGTGRVASVLVNCKKNISANKNNMTG